MNARKLSKAKLESLELFTRFAAVHVSEIEVLWKSNLLHSNELDNVNIANNLNDYLYAVISLALWRRQRGFSLFSSFPMVNSQWWRRKALASVWRCRWWELRLNFPCWIRRLTMANRRKTDKIEVNLPTDNILAFSSSAIFLPLARKLNGLIEYKKLLALGDVTKKSSV